MGREREGEGEGERGGRGGREREGSEVRYYDLVVRALYTNNIVFWLVITHFLFLIYCKCTS